MFAQMYFEYSSACGLGKHSRCLLNQLRSQVRSEERHGQCPALFAGGTGVEACRPLPPCPAQSKPPPAAGQTLLTSWGWQSPGLEALTGF